MKLECLRNLSLLAYFGVTVLLLGCNHSSTSVIKLPPFSVTNEMAGGDLREVITMTNGMSLYFTPSDLVFWFDEGSSITIAVNAETRGPANILLKRAATREHLADSVWDINADGIPEIKHVEGESNNCILYKGEWYARQYKGSNQMITVDGNKLEVRYDGHRFVAVTN